MTRVRRHPVDFVQTAPNDGQWVKGGTLTDWEREWRIEHFWHTRTPWGLPQVPPQPPTWKPGESTEEAWLRSVAPNGTALSLPELRKAVYR